MKPHGHLAEFSRAWNDETDVRIRRARRGSDAEDDRRGGRYRTGVGVATTTLLRGGIAVVSQRNHHTLGRLRAIDHHETAWFREYFAPAKGEG